MKILFKISAALALMCLLGQSAPSRAAIPHETPETSFEREALTFVQMLEKQPESIRRGFSLPACAERALAGLRLNPRLTLRFGTNLLACLEENVAEPIASAVNFKIVAFHRAGTEPLFLCRAAQRDGSVNYLDLIVERSRLGGCTIVDAFDYSAGMKLSEIARSTIEARAEEAQKNDHARLFGSRSELSKSANAIDHFQQLARNGDCAGALAAYAKLPPIAQKERLVLRTQIRCGTPADLPACVAALTVWRGMFSTDISTDLLALDYFKCKKLHDQYLDAVERIDRQVGGDPYLDVIRARYCQAQGLVDRTEKFARQAVQRDPGLREAHETLVLVLLEQKQFETAGQAISAEEQALGMDLGPVIRKTAQKGGPFAEFARSEAGARWLAENEQRAAQIAARVAAEADAAATSSDGRFKLESIGSAGGRGVATINGRTVGLGDRLLGGYRVSRIGPVSVNIVSTNGEVETLTLNHGLAGGEDR